MHNHVYIFIICEIRKKSNNMHNSYIDVIFFLGRPETQTLYNSYSARLRMQP